MCVMSSKSRFLKNLPILGLDGQALKSERKVFDAEDAKLEQEEKEIMEKQKKSLSPQTYEIIREENKPIKLRLKLARYTPLNDKLSCVAIPAGLLLNQQSTLYVPDTSKSAFRYFCVGKPANCRESLQLGDEVIPFTPFGAINPNTGENDEIRIQFQSYEETYYKEESNIPYQHKYYVIYNSELASSGHPGFDIELY